jgi:hypothetical protein
MAAVKFRDLGVAAQKLAQNGQAAAGRYVTAATAAAQTWQDHASGSEANWEAGIQAAITNKRFQAGVMKVGAAKYSGKIQLVGQNRFSDGISKAGPNWTKGFGAIAQQVAGVDLGPRGIRGSQQNKQRAANMSDAFRAAKMRSLGQTS